MMAKSAQILYRLQLLDTELSEQRSKLRETESLLGESQELIAARRARSQAEGELDTWRARLRDLEWDLQSLTDKITATEQRLYSGRVTNPKELAALQQDHEHMKRSRSKLEDEVLSAMTRLEECEKAFADTSARLTDIEARWRAEQERLSEERMKLQTRIAALSEKRAGLVAPLAVTELALYEELMRTKGGRAVALLAGGMCQGCRVTLPTSKAQSVRQSQELIVCTNCGRILVVEQ